MKKQKWWRALQFCGLLFAVSSAAAQQNRFTHQGRLLDSTGMPLDGVVDLSYTAFNDPVAGDNLGSSGKDGVSVSDGLFTAIVDLPGRIFDGSDVWLEISVNGTVLSPRVQMTATPNALFAREAAGSSGDFRVSNLGSSGQDGVRVIFGDGPDDLCTIGVDPNLSGIIVNDPGGLRVRNLGSSGQDGASRIVFGPTDDCSIGVDPLLPGLTERDPTGFRLLGQNNEGCRLIFGPTLDCTIEVNPQGPPGLTLRDVNCVRVLNPLPNLPTKLLFGPTDDCSIGIDPMLPGLTERDPTGFRLLGQNNQGCRLIFGPTMNCTVEVQPDGPPGLLLRDPSGIRILPPLPQLPPVLLFGPTDDCSIGVDPSLPGLTVRDPGGLRVRNLGSSGKDGVSRLAFGPTNDCAIVVDPNSPGMRLRDPGGIRIINPDPTGPATLLFGDSNACRIEASPNDGMIVYEQNGVTILNPLPGAPSVLSFSPNGECRFEAVPGQGMIVYEQNGVFFESQVGISLPPGQPVQFGIQLNPALGQRGSGFAAQWIEASSLRFKENIRPMDDALAIIDRLQSVRFDWNADHGGAADIGFVAEDVGAVLPEIVAWEDDGVHAKGMDYGRLTAVAIAGIQAQQQSLQDLQAENTSLRAEVDQLQRQMAEILAKLGDSN
ncbi:MAG: tail fiber domain-containing protein [Phycisphaerae bacterium]